MEAAAVPARQQHNSSNTNAAGAQTQQQQAAARTQQEQALARLQAQRLKSRAEQRLPAHVPAPAAAAAADDAPAGNKPRLRARVITTAGSGMQRQAPSCCSSVRGSLELQQGSAGRALQVSNSNGGLQVQGAAMNTSRQQQPPPPAPPQHLRGLTGSSHQQVLSRHVSSSRGSCSLRPHCQQAQLCAPVTAARPHPHAAAATATMGCGHTWGELQAAVAGAAGVQPLKAGGNLEHRRRVQQCRQSIAHLVVQQWRWFSTSSRQLRAAVALRRRRLLTAGWHGLSQEAGRMQLLGCRAQLQATKQSFLLLSRAFTAWQQLVELRKQLETVTDTLQAHRHRQTLRSVVQAWQEQVQRKRRKQQLLLRAEACYVFMTLLRVLQQWRARTTDKQVSRLRAARADQHWQQVVSRHVLQLWQAKAARGVAKWQSVAKALCFHKQRALSKALVAWSEAVQQQQDARAAAGTAFQGIACRLELHAAASTLQAWQQAAQVQVQHRQLLEAAAAARQLRTQRQVLRHWQQLLLYHQQLAAAATALQRLQPGVWLSHSFWRWRAIAQVLAGQRGDELRELVQLKACLGTWLQYTELRQHKAARLAAARAALRRLQLDRLLPAWQEATTRQQHKHSQLQRAQQHYQEHLQHRLLLVWQEAAAEVVVERLQLTAAAELHRLRLLAAGLKGLAWYPRYLARKAAAPEHYQQRLLTRVLAAWRDRTAAKQRAEQQRRLATRHHYLSTIHKVLQAWREAMAVACHKQQLAAAAEQHHNKRLLTAVLQVWQGPLLQHLQDTRRLKQARMAAAQRFRQQQLLRQGMQAFLLVRAGLQQERQELAAAADPALRVLGQRKQQRVLRAWLAAVTQQQRQRALKQTADDHACLLVVGRSTRQWQRYVASRHHKAAQAEVAVGHYQAALLAGGLDAFRQCVRDAAVGRRRMFAAAMHMRSWLIWRAFKALRLSAAVGHLERIVARESGASQPLTAADGGNSSSSSSSFSMQQRHQRQQLAPQQPQRAGMLPHSSQDPASVAAAVVEASCLRQKQWQDGWRSRWQQALTPQQQQQQQQDSLIHPPSLQQAQQQQQWPQQQVAVQPVPSHHPSQQQSMLAADLDAAGSVAHVGDRSVALSREAATPQPTGLAVGQEQVHPGSSHFSSASLTKRRARPQPRLPSFMLQEQQQGRRQQQPLLDSSGWLNTQQGTQEPHPQQLSGALAGGLSGVVMSRPTTPAVQQPPAPAEAAGWLGLQQGSLGLTSMSSVLGVAIARGSPASSAVQQPSSGLTWLSPQVGRRARLQPRQLKPSLLDSCGVVDSSSPGRVLQWQTDTAQEAGSDQQRPAEVLVVHSEAVPQVYPEHWAGVDD